jgi:mRNA interferase MazF
MKYRKYDIVLCNFPFTDFSRSKKRPALILSNIKGDNYIVC